MGIYRIIIFCLFRWPNNKLHIEEYTMHKEYTPSFGDSAPYQVEEHQQQSTRQTNAKRQISLIYGMEFSSQVPLFQRTYSSIQECGLNSLSQQELHKKVYCLLKSAVAYPHKAAALHVIFDDLQAEMGLSISRSKNSISISNSSSNDIVQNSPSSSLDEIPELKDVSNDCWKGRCSIKIANPPKRVSMMRKSNRISIADAIKVSELQDFKKLLPLEAIDSSNSVQSQQATNFDRKFEIISLSSSQSGSIAFHEKKAALQPKEKNKKISIMVVDLEGSECNSEIFSEDGEFVSLKNLRLPEMLFSEATVSTIFDSTCPLLVNLAVCLLLKCSSWGGVPLSEKNLGWMLGVSTIVAYKVYYDEPVTGLFECFGSIMGLSIDEIALMERWFLQKLNYEVVVSTKQFQTILFQLIAQ